jgi:hypothetical protein
MKNATVLFTEQFYTNYKMVLGAKLKEGLTIDATLNPFISCETLP